MCDYMCAEALAEDARHDLELRRQQEAAREELGVEARPIRVSLFAARTLNATAQSRVTLYRCGKRI